MIYYKTFSKMPRCAIDYTNTVIYTIVSKDLNLDYCYVGSTTDFTRRKAQHKMKCKSFNNAKLYKTINENGGWEEFDMVVIENFNCKNGIEATTRERYWYEILNCNLNSYIPIRKMNERTNRDQMVIDQRMRDRGMRDQGDRVKSYTRYIYDTSKNPEWFLKNIENQKYNKNETI
jgi:predicted GIY-YIG superfamily endonuclease